MTPILTKAFAAAAAILGHRIVAATANGKVTTAASATALSIGVSDAMGAPAGGMLDVVQAGWSELKLGGAVAFGDPLTADASGRGIKGVPVAGSVVRTVGFAMADGVEDDIVPVLIAPGIINTPA